MVKLPIKQGPQPNFDTRNALRLVNNIGISIDEYGAFLTFGASEEQPERMAYYELHALGSDQLVEVAEALLQVSEQLSMIELLDADTADDMATVNGPLTIQ